MEWKIYIKKGEKSYRVLKIMQGANLDIYLIPRNAVYFSREIIAGLNVGDQIELHYEKLGDQIDHYSVHSLTGQRHVKLNPSSRPLEPTIGTKLDKINKAIPLVTIVASINQGSEEKPSSGKWFGYNLPPDVNYIVMDLIAIPKKSNIKFQQNFKIQNDKKTNESFDTKILEMQNCNVIVLTRSTNHGLTDIPNNVIFQQVEGKTVIVSRVERGKVLAQVSMIEVV
jgi:hypothetical protein